MIIKYGVTEAEFEVIDAANMPNWMRKKEQNSEKEEQEAATNVDSDSQQSEGEK